jgi:hypothetical protein
LASLRALVFLGSLTHTTGRCASHLFTAAMLLLFSENPRKFHGREKIRDKVTASLCSTMRW